MDYRYAYQEEYLRIRIAGEDGASKAKITIPLYRIAEEPEETPDADEAPGLADSPEP